MGLGLKQLTENSQFRYSRMYTGRGEADIVLLGNSRGLNFYQPFIEKQSGKSTLNLSYNAMPVNIGMALLKDYLDLYEAPEHLIVDVTFLDRENDELVRDFRVYGQFSDRLDSILAVRDPSIYGGTKFSHLTKYGGEVAQRMLFYYSKVDTNWIVDRVISRQVAEASADLEPYRNDYNLNRIRQLAEVAKSFEAAGTKVHFVINPYYPAFKKSITNLDSLSNDVRKLTGISVLDYSGSISGDENFGDYQHLNKAGASIYIERLVSDLKL